MKLLCVISISKIGLLIGIAAWALLFLAGVSAIGDYQPGTPISAYETKLFYVRLYIYIGAVLLFASVVLASSGLKRDKRISILTYAVHLVMLSSTIILELL